MYKNLFLMVLMAIGFAGTINAQKIEIDDVTQVAGREVRMISASSEVFRSFTDKVILSLNLMATLPTGETTPEYTLCASLKANAPISAPANARILIKAKDGDVISLEESSHAEKEDNIGEIQVIGGQTFKFFRINLLYKVTPEEIAQMATGVMKIRIETNGEKPYEKEWKKDKIGKFIATEYDLISKALAATPDKRGSFEDDF